MATKKQLTPDQRVTWDALASMGLEPEDYSDFDADAIREFPPIPAELGARLKEIQDRTRQALNRLEQRVHD